MLPTLWSFTTSVRSVGIRDFGEGGIVKAAPRHRFSAVELQHQGTVQTHTQLWDSFSCQASKEICFYRFAFKCFMGIWFLTYCMKEIVQEMRNLFVFFQLNFFFLFSEMNYLFTKRLTCTVYVLKVGCFFCVITYTFPIFSTETYSWKSRVPLEGTNTLTSNHVNFKNRLLNSVFFNTYKETTFCLHIYVFIF